MNLILFQLFSNSSAKRKPPLAGISLQKYRSKFSKNSRVYHSNKLFKRTSFSFSLALIAEAIDAVDLEYRSLILPRFCRSTKRFGVTMTRVPQSRSADFEISGSAWWLQFIGVRFDYARLNSGRDRLYTLEGVVAPLLGSRGVRSNFNNQRPWVFTPPDDF